MFKAGRKNFFCLCMYFMSECSIYHCWLDYFFSLSRPSSCTIHPSASLLTLSALLLVTNQNYCGFNQPCHHNLPFLRVLNFDLSVLHIGLLSYSLYWTRTSIQWRLMRGNIIKNSFISFALEKIYLHYAPLQVPVRYWENKNCISLPMFLCCLNK